MPTVNGNKGSRQQPGARQTHSREEMKKIHQPDRPQDDLYGDFEGKNNSGPAGDKKPLNEARDHTRNRGLSRHDREEGKEPKL
jgi:hypothetical protein